MQYMEPASFLSQDAQNVVRALTSMKEELEAISWYYQRAQATKDPKLREVMIHSMEEEIEHAKMAWEYLNKNMPGFQHTWQNPPSPAMHGIPEAPFLKRQRLFPKPEQLPPEGVPMNLALTDPRFNMREICKNFLLLEDHLQHQQKRCPDCITKHFLLTEALADEMATLCMDPNACYQSQNLSAIIRSLHHSYHQGENPVSLANKIRMLRKSLCAMLFGYGQG